VTISACKDGYAIPTDVKTTAKKCVSCTAAGGTYTNTDDVVKTTTGGDANAKTCTITAGAIVVATTECKDGYDVPATHNACVSCTIEATFTIPTRRMLVVTTTLFDAHAKTCTITAAGVVTPITCTDGYDIPSDSELDNN
jgi:hypothetical protein